MKRLFLDLGDGNVIPKKKVVMILDAESATLQETTRNFIKKNNSRGDEVKPLRLLRNVNSFILTSPYGKDSLYSSSRLSKSLAEDYRNKTSELAKERKENVGK